MGQKGTTLGPMMGLPMVELSTLVLDPKNARAHNERNIVAIADSLRRFGQRRPIVVRRSDRLVEAGNGMVIAFARNLGKTHAEVLWVDDSEQEAAAYGLADNRTAELAAWDIDAMLDAFDVAGDLVTGWTDDEIDHLREIAGVGETKAGFPKLDGTGGGRAPKPKPVAFYVLPEAVPALQEAIEAGYAEGAGSAMEAIAMMARAYVGGRR